MVEFSLEENFEILARVNENSEYSKIQKAVNLILKSAPRYLNMSNLSQKNRALLITYKSMLMRISSLKTSELAQLGAEVAFCARSAGNHELADQIIGNIPHYFWY